MLEILRAFVGIPRGVPTHRTERHSSQLSANIFILSSLRSTQNSICSAPTYLFKSLAGLLAWSVI